MKHKKFFPLLFLVIIVLGFFYQSIFNNKFPVPADSLVGLYHPYRDLYASTNPNGIAYKNFLITDPVRQQYPWRFAAIEQIKNGEFPLWNPYSGAGEPFFANMQASLLYPLNLVFFILPFRYAWTLGIISQLLLASIFMFLYLKNRKLTNEASLFGSIAFSFSGFFIAWLTWNTLIHVALWLPLALLAVDKIVEGEKTHSKLKWIFVLVASVVFSFFAGHLQTYFYLGIVVMAYVVFHMLSVKKPIEKILLFAGVAANVFVLISVQLFAVFFYISQSSRQTDQLFFQDKEGWFIPWQHVVQFVAPDFFGNPATLNYWGTWNYGEMVGYVGIIPLAFALYGLIFKRAPIVWFYGILLGASFLFALPTFFARLPFELSIPFISTSQPTRLLMVIDFSLACLAAFGFDMYFRNKSFDKRMIIVGALLGCIFVSLFVYVCVGGITQELQVARRNMYIPIGMFLIGGLLIVANMFIKHIKLRNFVVLGLILLSTIDLFRFGWKFTPFVSPEYLFPTTRTISYVKEQTKDYPWRFVGVDYLKNQKRIAPPNIAAYYGLYTIDTYNPLLLKHFQNYAAVAEWGDPDLENVSFNRMIELNNYESRLLQLAGVKYLASLSDLPSEKYRLLFREGDTRLYENTQVFPRAFMIYDYAVSESDKSTAQMLQDTKLDLRKIAIVEKALSFTPKTPESDGKVIISSYKPNSVKISVTTAEDGLLLLTDTYYPTWKVTIDGKRSEVLRVDMTFRGVVIPKGEHEVVFYPTIL